MKSLPALWAAPVWHRSLFDPTRVGCCTGVPVAFDHSGPWGQIRLGDDRVDSVDDVLMNLDRLGPELVRYAIDRLRVWRPPWVAAPPVGVRTSTPAVH